MGPGDARSDPDEDAALLTPLGEFMQRRHAELGLSVAAVAKRVGMSRATWYRIARGESASPSVRLLRELARVYKVRAAELFSLVAHVGTVHSVAKSPSIGGEAGDALWRCRHDRQVRCGSWIEVDIELLNLSDRPWLTAELRGVHDAWLAAGDRSGSRSPAASVDGHGQSRCRASLPPTGPGEWAQTHVRLRAPLATGPWISCLAVYLGTSSWPVGSGGFVLIETQ